MLIRLAFKLLYQSIKSPPIDYQTEVSLKNNITALRFQNVSLFLPGEESQVHSVWLLKCATRARVPNTYAMTRMKLDEETDEGKQQRRETMETSKLSLEVQVY